MKRNNNALEVVCLCNRHVALPPSRPGVGPPPPESELLGRARSACGVQNYNAKMVQSIMHGYSLTESLSQRIFANLCQSELCYLL